MEPIDISGLKVTGDRSGVASQGVEFETSVDFNGNGPIIFFYFLIYLFIYFLYVLLTVCALFYIL